MDGYVQEVEFMYSGFVADTDVNIIVCVCHVRLHIKYNR